MVTPQLVSTPKTRVHRGVHPFDEPDLRAELVEVILDTFWPATLHDALRHAVGLQRRPPRQELHLRLVRDPSFRDAVLRAYGCSCAVCGYDGRLGGAPLGLEAAHLRWHAYQGPDVIENGLALCTYHHVALDRGAIGLTETLLVQVSSEAQGATMVDELPLRFHDAPLRRPQAGLPSPTPVHIQWHREEVFRSPARAA